MEAVPDFTERRKAPLRRYPLIADFLRMQSSADGCWIYPSSRDRDGYATYKEARRATRAHRAAYLSAHGALPPAPSNYVLHRCDQPACVRPDHLFAGSARDNAIDAMQKDRHSRGERNGASKLTPEQVKAIRRDARTQSAIAADYGIRQTTVSEIRSAYRWGHVR